MRTRGLEATGRDRARRTKIAFLTIAVACCVAACSSAGNTRSPRAGGDTLSERQRDSMLSTSKIPGASGVGKAMTAADTASARVRAADSVQ